MPSHLIICPSCGHQMYRWAPHCISCGYPLAYDVRSQRKFNPAGTLLFLLGLGLCAIAGTSHSLPSNVNGIIMGAAFLALLISASISLKNNPPRR